MSETAKLGPRQRKYVAGRARGLPKRQAALKAGLPTPRAADKFAERQSQNVAVQRAIDEALAKHELTADFAVSKIGSIANMELEARSAPSVLKASQTILELHGWRKEDKPNMTLNINQFFGKARTSKRPVIEQT